MKTDGVVEGRLDVVQTDTGHTSVGETRTCTYAVRLVSPMVNRLVGATYKSEGNSDFVSGKIVSKGAITSQLASPCMMYHDRPTHQLADVLMHPMRGLLERILTCGGITGSYLQGGRVNTVQSFRLSPGCDAPSSCVRSCVHWPAMAMPQPFLPQVR